MHSYRFTSSWRNQR